MIMEILTALEFIKKLQMDFREAEYESAEEAQVQNIITEVYCKEIIEALEKQIPKKIVRKSCAEKSILACPNCSVNLGIEFYGEDGKITGLQCIDDIPPVARCCKFCGQAIID